MIITAVTDVNYCTLNAKYDQNKSFGRLATADRQKVSGVLNYYRNDYLYFLTPVTLLFIS